MCVFHECLNWEAIYKVFWASVEFFFLFTQGCNYFDVLCLFCFQIISKWMVKKTPAHFKNQRQLTWWGSSCVSDLRRGTDLCWAPSAGARQPSDRWNGTSAFPGNMALAACLHKFCPCGTPAKSANCAPIKEDWRTHTAAEQHVCRVCLWWDCIKQEDQV